MVVAGHWTWAVLSSILAASVLGMASVQVSTVTINITNFLFEQLETIHYYRSLTASVKLIWTSARSPWWIV